MNVGRVVIEMSRTAADHGLKMPPELALLGKTFLHLDEVGRVLDPEFDVNASLRRNASSVMRRRMMKSATPANLFSAAMDVREFAERLPGRRQQDPGFAGASDLRFKVEVIDQGSIIEGCRRSRTGLRSASSSRAHRRRGDADARADEPDDLRLPWIAMLLFLAAAAGGFWMAWTILAGTSTRPARDDVGSVDVEADLQVRLGLVRRRALRRGDVDQLRVRRHVRVDDVGRLGKGGGIADRYFAFASMRSFWLAGVASGLS